MPERVPFVALDRQHAPIQGELRTAFERVLGASTFILGEEVAAFEDAAQAHGATWRGRRTGTLGTAAAFSFYPSKNLGALGDGGVICTNDPSIADRARALRDLGQARKGEHDLTGWNERLDGLQAA